MAYHIPYTGKTFTAPTSTVPGNDKDPNPVQFDIVPAWGADQARAKSVVYSTLGLIQTTDWTPAIQEAVIAAFETGAPIFVTSIQAIRNLSIPAAMALRAGIIQKLPTKVAEGGGVVPDPAAPILVTTGKDFSLICGDPGVLVLAYQVACEIVAIGKEAAQETDPRFFAQPSGSHGKGTAKKAKGSTARTARRTSNGPGTADNGSTDAGT